MISGSVSLPSTLVLWDVDHTLIENGGVSKETYMLTFELLTGRAPAVLPVTDGRTDFQIMRELMEANSMDVEKYAEISHVESKLIEAMSMKAPELPRRGHVLPGVVEAITALDVEPEVIQSALTGNIEQNALAKLSAFNLNARIDLAVGGFGSDDIVRSKLVDAARGKVQKKYGVTFDRSSTVLIGDTPLDVKAGRDGGAKVIAVATGRYSLQELSDAGPNATLEDLANLDQFLTTLIEVRSNPGFMS
jgi:phosphoglycolate phosphatase